MYSWGEQNKNNKETIKIQGKQTKQIIKTMINKWTRSENRNKTKNN